VKATAGAARRGERDAQPHQARAEDAETGGFGGGLRAPPGRSSTPANAEEPDEVLRHRRSRQPPNALRRAAATRPPRRPAATA
jgi:hypothetical protein